MEKKERMLEKVERRMDGVRDTSYLHEKCHFMAVVSFSLFLLFQKSFIHSLNKLT